MNSQPEGGVLVKLEMDQSVPAGLDPSPHHHLDHISRISLPAGTRQSVTLRRSPARRRSSGFVWAPIRALPITGVPSRISRS